MSERSGLTPRESRFLRALSVSELRSSFSPEERDLIQDTVAWFACNPEALDAVDELFLPPEQPKQTALEDEAAGLAQMLRNAQWSMRILRGSHEEDDV